MVKVGIIGGSGLDKPGILEDFKEIEVNTPFGKPSDKVIHGKLGNAEVFILPRHGKKHTISPTGVNYRANIYALKEVDFIIATTACGSLREEMGRGDLVILDQFIDFTKHRNITFHDDFEQGAKHTPMASPFNEKLRSLLIKTIKNLDYKVHDKGTVITIEGPRFSTKAESKMFRAWGADVINMSIAPEAILANELNIPYATIAMVTDYDCWKEDETVSWEIILKVFHENAEKVKKILIESIKSLGNEENSIKESIRTVPNWPKQGIMFRDVTTLLKDPSALNYVTDKFIERYKDKDINKIVAIESRGFIFGSILANKLNLSFIPARKPGKLPAETVSEEYELEYGKDKIEIHKDAIAQGDKVLVVDDLIATGGTCLAACNLVKKLGGEIVECSFVIELPDLHGKEKLEKHGYKIFSLVRFEGE